MLPKHHTPALLLTFILTLLPFPAQAASTLPITSVVKINAENVQSGSGVSIDNTNQYILTNAHVALHENTYKPFEKYEVCTIRSAADEARCTYIADLIYADVDEDLAILHVRGNFQQPAISINSDSLPDVGTKLTAFGFPALGGDSITLSQGIVSGFLKDNDGNIQFIKTDSNLLSGMSGGLALDQNGAFTGIPSQYYSDNQDERIGILIAATKVKTWYQKTQLAMQAPGFKAPKIVTKNPGSIDNLQAKKMSPTSVQLSWETPVTNKPISNYEITYDTKNPLENDVSSTAQLPNYKKIDGTKTSYLIQHLEAGKTYYFSVSPTEAKAWSKVVTLDLRSGETGDKIFSDVDYKNKNANAIEYLRRERIIDGYPDGTFRPDAIIHRAELVKLIIAGQDIYPEPQNYNHCFSDVKDEWYAPYVCYAKEKKWITGYADGGFHPAQEVNFAEVLKIVQTAYGIPFNKMPIYDVIPNDQRNQWYTPYLNSAVEFNIVNSATNTTKIDEKMSRGKTSEILYRTIMVSQNKENYSSTIWKGADHENIEPFRYLNIREGIVRKIELQNGENDAIMLDATIKKGTCVQQKNPDCYTIDLKKYTSSFIHQEVTFNARGVQGHEEQQGILDDKDISNDQSIIFEEPIMILPNNNIVRFFKAKNGHPMEQDGRSFSILDGITSFNFLGTEKIPTPLGEKDSIKIKGKTILRIKVTKKEGSYFITQAIEETIYFVKDIGVIKGEQVITKRLSNGEIYYTEKGSETLKEISMK